MGSSQVEIQASLQYQLDDIGAFTQSLPIRLPSTQQVVRWDCSSTETKSAMKTLGDFFKHGANYWTRIPSDKYWPSLVALSKLCHSTEDLLKNRYLVEAYGSDEISTLRRCKNCNGES